MELVEDWGLSSEAVRKALAMKVAQDMKRKEKTIKQSATQKYKAIVQSLHNSSKKV
jgi:hypothetical protein